MLDEEFYTNPYDQNQEDEKVPQFPLSSMLREQRYFLGRNARMVAAQPMDRTIYNQQVLLNHFILWTSAPNVDIQNCKQTYSLENLKFEFYREKLSVK